MGKSNLIGVVAGILFDPNGKILVSKRPSHVPQGGLWEFPGGKIEENETPYDALCRELWEELGIRVTKAKLFASTLHHYSEKQVQLGVWKVEAYTLTPVGKEGQQIEWIFPDQLTKRPFPPANQAIIHKLAGSYPDGQIGEGKNNS